MIRFPFRSVRLESYALHLPETEVSSTELEDRVAPLYERLKVPFGTLEKVSGVKTRRLWDPTVSPSSRATVAAKEALEKIGFAREECKALINCSVTRDYFEPSTSALAHGNMEWPEDTLSFDITNACVGFSNGIQMVGNLIESGIIKAGVVVSAENISCIIESTVKLILEKDSDAELTRDGLLRLLPTFTLGCGAAAAVLAHESIATSDHRIVGCVSRSATQHNMLCVGNADFGVMNPIGLNPIMHTESQGLIGEAALLGKRMWSDFQQAFEWDAADLDHIFCHNVGRQVNQSFYDTQGLDFSKDFAVYPRLGNMVSCSLPGALFTGVEEKNIQAGEKILLTGYGSGLNSIFTGIIW
ncbi:MAG: 3-oxoacyl-ACP synthase III [Bdellovibrionales bacterium]|nr:3-oxoacyl-ACP synthase III [Bdellovibrionales bacterium]